MLDFAAIEKEVKDFWKIQGTYKKLLERKGKKYFFLDGPPYANNIPHVGHIRNTIMKDLIIRLKFMQGHRVFFQPGFDTHGLPIENMIEKKLGFQGKKDIEKYGIGKFMQECRNNATLNKDLWQKVYENLGSIYSLKEPYLTYENYYIDSGWWTFSEMHKKGLVYSGEKPVMWCPHCETSLAGYEITDSYKMVSDPGIYALFKLNGKDEYLLVYTTTPWTLPANVALAVSENEIYSKVEVNGKKIILGEKRLEKLKELGLKFKLLGTIKGKDLIGKNYEPLLNIPLQYTLNKGKIGKAHVIIASIPLLKERVASKVKAKKGVKGKDLFEEFVTMDEGTGIVHVAPGHGKTDYIIGQHYKLAIASPVDDSGNFTEESGFSGFVKKADKEIIERLKEEGKLLHHETITHSYPLCWRCKTPLIFRLSKQLFVKIEKIKQKMQSENKKVNWMPEFANERFENWIENAEDWNISRQRFWGIPIPVWECENSHETVIESKAMLEKLSGKTIKDMHESGDITFKCKQCSNIARKVKGVLDVWFDSGIASWASFGYPWMQKKEFKEIFPTDRISEGPDQIRGWFYSQMFCSISVFNETPFKEASMIEWVVDKNGNKMSKSQGNYISGEDAIKMLGADVLRYYICWDIAPYEIQKFNEEIAKKEIGKLFNVLANIGNLASRNEAKESSIENNWIISRLNSLIKNYTANIEKFDVHLAMRSLSDFILNDLSRTYIQMTRDRENGAVISLCLENILKLIAPVSPFLAEKLWQSLKEKKIVKEDSVHLCSWPISNEKEIDENLEKDFIFIAEIIENGLKERDIAKIGLRWPLASATLHAQTAIDKKYHDIISRQLNVKKIILKKGKGREIKVELDTKQNAGLEAEGFARELARKIQAERKDSGLKKGEGINLTIFSDAKMIGMLKLHEHFLKERTNAEKIEFADGKMPKEIKLSTIRERKIGFNFRNS